MAAILTTAKITCKSSEARETVIDAFRKIIAYTAPNEPEVLQYVCAVPVEDSLKTEIYMIEEYTSQAASDAHLATQPVQDLIKLFTTSDVLAAPPEVHNSSVAVKNFSGPLIPVSANPAIVLVNVGYKTGTTAHAVEGWREVGKSAISSVQGFNVFTVAEDKEASSVRAMYVLDGWASFEKFHTSGVAEKIKEHNGKDMSGVAEGVKIRAVDGYVGREDRGKL